MTQEGFLLNSYYSVTSFRSEISGEAIVRIVGIINNKTRLCTSRFLTCFSGCNQSLPWEQSVLLGIPGLPGGLLLEGNTVRKLAVLVRGRSHGTAIFAWNHQSFPVANLKVSSSFWKLFFRHMISNHRYIVKRPDFGWAFWPFVCIVTLL